MEYIPYGKQTITEEDIQSVIKTLKSPLITQGAEVPLFESRIKHAVHSKHAICVNSATSALHIACQALGLTKGDWLWTSPITFVASANCGIYCGARVDFVDIEEKTGLMCTKKLEEKLKRAKVESRLPKIVIPVHLGGSSCNMKRIKELSEEFNFKIVEDASHAIGGKYYDECIGNCKYSDATVFSFHPVKIITTGEGGAVTTNSEKLSKKLKTLRSHGITKDKRDFEQNELGLWYYEQQSLGYNYRMTDIQAALGNSQISRLNQIVAERQRLYDIYRESLEKSSVELIQEPEGCYSSVHLAIILVRNCTKHLHQEYFKNLRDKGIGVQLHYLPVHLQPYYRNCGFKKGDYPQAENYAQSAMSIPLYPGIKDHEQKYVIDTIKEVIK